VLAARLGGIRQAACYEDVLASALIAPDILNFGTTRLIKLSKVKSKVMLVETHGFVRRRGSHIF
jgi:hypothetical protein